MADNGQLTPYKSPGALRQSSRKGRQSNVTGQERKLKDMAAELHNAADKWESLNTKGNSILNDIVNVKLQYIYQQNDENEAGEERMSVKTLSEKLEPKCQALQHVTASMEDVVKKMLSLTTVVQGLRSLSAHQGDSDNILFSLWTIHQFVDTVEAVHSMYAKEVNLKKELCRNVAYADTRASLMFYAAAWLHQPYVDSQMKITALLLETGHTS